MPKYQCPKCEQKFIIDETPPGGLMDCPTCAFHLHLPTGNISGGDVIGGYRVEELIGVGGMGEVFRATQLAMARTVALKILPRAMAENSEDSRRFLQEVRLLARLQHPHIVEAIEAGRDKEHFFLAMSYVDGEALDARLADGGRFSEAQGLEIALTLAGTLGYAWDRHQILHRDIKPANIMLDRQGAVKLMDMGISKCVGEEGTMMSMAGVVRGTPDYISPEQAQGLTDLDCRTDIYSLGATLYHLVTGTVPFRRDSVTETLLAQVHDPLPPPAARNAELSGPCCQLLQWMMAKAPRDRPPSWPAVAAAIAQVIAGQSPTGASAPAEHRKRKRKKRKPVRRVAARPRASSLPVPVARPPGHAGLTVFLWLVLAGVIVVGVAKHQGVDLPALLREILR